MKRESMTTNEQLDSGGVAKAARSISNVRYMAARQRSRGKFVDEQDEFRHMAVGAINAYESHRAATTRDEREALREALRQIAEIGNRGVQEFGYPRKMARLAEAALTSKDGDDGG